MSNYTKTWYIIVLIFVIVLGMWGLNRNYWGDESHFVETIRVFSTSSWVDSVKDYPEVTTPLVYVIYSGWGKLFGTSLPALRLLSLLISISFFILIFHFFKSWTTNGRTALILSVLLLLNPYMWGLSIFVFTDMTALLLIYVSLYAVKKNKTWIAALVLGLAVLCRQYSVIFILAVGLFLLYKFIREQRKTAFYTFTGLVILALIPFVILVLTWKGLSPPEGTKIFIPYTSIHWNPNALTTYITFSAIYVLPMILLSVRKLYKYKMLLIPAVILGSLIFIFPVEASGVSRIWNNTETVGLFHKFLVRFTGGGVITGVILYIFFTLGLWVLIIFIKEDLAVLKSGKASGLLLLSLSFYIFLILMPFSYQVWEKYLIMIIPVLLLRLAYFLPDRLAKSV